MFHVKSWRENLGIFHLFLYPPNCINYDLTNRNVESHFLRVEKHVYKNVFRNQTSQIELLISTHIKVNYMFPPQFSENKTSVFSIRHMYKVISVLAYKPYTLRTQLRVSRKRKSWHPSQNMWFIYQKLFHICAYIPKSLI